MASIKIGGVRGPHDVIATGAAQAASLGAYYSRPALIRSAAASRRCCALLIHRQAFTEPARAAHAQASKGGN